MLSVSSDSMTRPGHDERAVARAVDLLDPRADRRAEHDEVQRRRQHGRDDALHDRAEHARHLEVIDRVDGVPIHADLLTRLTKISSSELCVVLQIVEADAGVARALRAAS